jgi:hypothetical protein
VIGRIRQSLEDTTGNPAESRVRALAVAESMGSRAAVHEFTIRIQTPRGTTTDEAAAARVATAIDSAEEIAGAETTLDARQRTISTSLRVKATTLDEAQETALRIFTGALGLAQVVSMHGWLLIEAAGP